MMLPPEHPDAPKYWMHETSGVLAPACQEVSGGRKNRRARNQADSGIPRAMGQQPRVGLARARGSKRCGSK